MQQRVVDGLIQDSIRKADMILGPSMKERAHWGALAAVIFKAMAWDLGIPYSSIVEGATMICKRFDIPSRFSPHSGYVARRRFLLPSKPLLRVYFSTWRSDLLASFDVEYGQVRAYLPPSVRSFLR